MKTSHFPPFLCGAILFIAFKVSAEPAGSKVPVVAAEGKVPVVAAEGIGAFGSGDPVARADVPERGQIVIPGGGKMQAMGHWDQYDWKVETPRWGNYEVLLTYGLKLNSLGVQLKMGETRLKTRLTAALFDEPKTVSLGTLYFPAAGEQSLSLYTPPIEQLKGVDFQGLRLVPAPEGEAVKQGEDGSVILEAKNATTWSTTMRYEPKPEKNCLGFWTQVEDWAEWEFSVERAGKFEVDVFQGCGGKNGGSEVGVVLGDQELTFKVIDTAGFQDFKPVAAGQFEIGEPGNYRLAIKPRTKAGKAIMDVQKIILTPVK